MKSKQSCGLLIGVGMTLVVFSYLLPTLVGGRRAWSEEDARAYSQAGAKLHDAIHDHAGEHGHAGGATPHAVPLKEAEERFAEHKAKLESAQNRGRFMGRVLFGLGVICLGIGIVVFLVSEN